MSPRINYFHQVKCFYESVWHGSNRMTSHHNSLYMFLLNQNNRTKWSEWFDLALDVGMKGSCIGTKKTYYETLKSLEEWGFIRYEKGANEWRAPRISINPLKDKGLELPKPEKVEVLNDTSAIHSGIHSGIDSAILPPTTQQYPDKDLDTNTRPKTKDKAQEIPADLLLVSGFESAWDDWLEHLKEKKKNPTSKAIELQFKKLLSVSDPVGMINHSIEKNWTGLFEPNNSFQQKKAEPELTLDQYAHRAGAEAFKKMKSNVDDAGW